MSEPTNDAALDEVGDASPMRHLLVPLVAVGATMIARKVIDMGYRRVTGHAAPNVDDPGTSLRRAMLWAAVGAVVAAEVEVLVHRLTMPRH